MLANIVHIVPITTIRRERTLPVAGKVIVRKGQKVTATETVAEAVLAPSHMLIDIARGLGISVQEAESQIQFHAGEPVAEGDVLAGPVGFTRRVIRAPRPGRIAYTGNGQILIEVQGKPFELKAGFPGTVVDLISERGAIIENTGMLIQGVWGNGNIEFGLLNVLAKEPGHVLKSDQMDVSLRGSVIFAGHASQPDVLKAAADLPLKGLILASMDSALIEAARKVSFPVIVLEGFGQRIANTAAFKLLSSNNRREAALNAEPWNRSTGARPEVIIPLPAQPDTPAPSDATVYTAGQQVRVTRAPNSGRTGELVDIFGIAVLPNGIRAKAGEVRFEDGSTDIIPLANLEVLQ
jgi:hypothetical protein